MPYARAGIELEIDLSQGKIEKRDNDPQLYENYLGGRGTITKMFWDRVSPEIEPFSPDNLLIFGVGLLTGTTAPGVNRTAILTRSPQTNLLTYSMLGGFWGAEFKHAGYDTLIISGKAPAPVYVCINDENVEIRDANHLWGKDVRESQKIIRQELNKDKAQILCIGPAGEHKVYVATIEQGFGSGVSRAGAGAIMGDKNLKAIAVTGTKDLSIAEPSEFNEVCEYILKKTGRIKKYWDDWAYETGKWLLDKGFYGNFDKFMPIKDSSQFLEAFVEKFKTRVTTCYNCGVGCKSVVSLPDGSYSFLKCQIWFNFLLACKIQVFNSGFGQQVGVSRLVNIETEYRAFFVMGKLFNFQGSYQFCVCYIFFETGENAG